MFSTRATFNKQNQKHFYVIKKHIKVLPILEKIGQHYKKYGTINLSPIVMGIVFGAFSVTELPVQAQFIVFINSALSQQIYMTCSKESVLCSK